MDVHGNIYVSERYGDKVMKISKDGVVTAVARNGTARLSGDGGLAIILH
ncbi:hypothetical protein ACFSRY_18040 [Pontibacter locisalis]|uniref:NHL repeat-containing protein n=1 Tax=Pontibacter locisalis TaxID=1719035 RepID=A0ABW5IS34_9BACT